MVLAVPTFALTVGGAAAAGPSYEVIDFSSWSIDENLDNGCTFRFEARGNSLAAQTIDELASDAWIYQDGQPIGRFRIVRVSQDWGASGEDSITCEGICYRRMLSYRVVQSPLSFTSTSQGQIVWDLIQHTQSQTNGNLGITLGTIGSTVARTRDYLPGVNIFEAITELTQIENGLAWDIDPTLALQIYDPAAYPLIAQPIILGVNARALSRPSSADKFANSALVIGNNEVVSPVTVDAATLPTDTRGRWEKVATLSNETLTANLIETGEGMVNESLAPVSTWRADIEPTQYFGLAPYQVGDYVDLGQPRSTVYPVGNPAPVVRCQVIARSLSQDAAGAVSVRLSLIEVPS